MRKVIIFIDFKKILIIDILSLIFLISNLKPTKLCTVINLNQKAPISEGNILLS